MSCNGICSLDQLLLLIFLLVLYWYVESAAAKELQSVTGPGMPAADSCQANSPAGIVQCRGDGLEHSPSVRVQAGVGQAHGCLHHAQGSQAHCWAAVSFQQVHHRWQDSIHMIFHVFTDCSMIKSRSGCCRDQEYQREGNGLIRRLQ